MKPHGGGAGVVEIFTDGACKKVFENACW